MQSAILSCYAVQPGRHFSCASSLNAPKWGEQMNFWVSHKLNNRLAEGGSDLYTSKLQTPPTTRRHPMQLWKIPFPSKSPRAQFN